MTVDPVVTELRARCVGEVRGSAPLAELTTLRVGGRGRVLLVAETDADLVAASEVARAHALPVTVLGRGSNVLVADAGWPGLVVQLGRGFRELTVEADVATVGGAEPLPVMAVRLADLGFTGLAWACAVPGTLGGAVRMNAGAHGGQLADHLLDVDVVRLGTGSRETWPVDMLGLGYRRSELPDDAVVVAARLRLRGGDPATLRAEIAGIRAWRRAHQPLNEPNCGSVFTNPPDGSAGQLIEAAGCKGAAIGGARISERHANFIVTRPGATAGDVAGLIARVQDRVRASAGVDLVPEVRHLGDVVAATDGVAAEQADVSS